MAKIVKTLSLSRETVDSIEWLRGIFPKHIKSRGYDRPANQSEIVDIAVEALAVKVLDERRKGAGSEPAREARPGAASGGAKKGGEQ